jgi:thiamine pyrophosphate-dependent acetolactate synthase large subunit-like protein
MFSTCTAKDCPLDASKQPDRAVLRKDILDHITDRAEEDRFPLTPQRIVHDVRQVMPPDGIVALDNGMYKSFVRLDPASGAREK